MPILRRRRPRARAASVQASRTGSGRERPSLQSPRRARSTPRGCRRRLMGTRAVWQAVSGLCLAGSYLSDGCTCLQSPAARGGGGRTARLWLQPTPSTYLYMFFQIRFQTSARRLIRSDLSDGIGRIQIRPHILGASGSKQRLHTAARRRIGMRMSLGCVREPCACGVVGGSGGGVCPAYRVRIRRVWRSYPWPA